MSTDMAMKVLYQFKRCDGVVAARQYYAVTDEMFVSDTKLSLGT